MPLGNSLFQARKNCGMSQQDVAQILGVSRQTISKWETDETTPDLAQGKRLAALYRLSLDELTGSCSSYSRPLRVSVKKNSSRLTGPRFGHSSIPFLVRIHSRYAYKNMSVLCRHCLYA